MAWISFICFLFIFFTLPALPIGKPLDDISTDTWTSDLQSLTSWISYGKQAYYYHQPELNMLQCIASKLWNLTYNYIHNSDEEIVDAISYVAEPGSENSGNESMEKFNRTMDAGMDIRVVSTNSREGRGGLERGRLASLLGVTGERFVKDYNCTVVAGRKVDGLNKKSEGEIEEAMLQMILKSEPIGPLIVKLLNILVLIGQNIIYWIRKSVVLSCLTDYINEKFSEWMYLDL